MWHGLSPLPAAEVVTSCGADKSMICDNLLVLGEIFQAKPVASHHLF